MSQAGELTRLVDVLYRDYVLSGKVLKLIKKRATSRWQKHEAETAVERLLQTSANRLPLAARSALRADAASLIWDAALKDEQAFEKLRGELERKAMKGLAEELRALVCGLMALPIERLVDNYAPPAVKFLAGARPVDRGCKPTALAYGKWRAKITPRIQALVEKYDALQVVASKMLYDAMFPRGSSWSLPKPYFEVLPKDKKPKEERRGEAVRPPPRGRSPEAASASLERDLSKQEPLFPDGFPVFLYNDRPWDLSPTPRVLSPVLSAFPPAVGDPPEVELLDRSGEAGAADRSASGLPGEAEAADRLDVCAEPGGPAEWTEGFSNPFNSTLMDFGHSFCSLWPVVDACFGGRAGFFDLPSLAGSNWCLNPPFIETVLADTASKILDFYCSPGRHPEKILFLAPRWRDAKFYEVILRLAKVIGVSEIERTLTATGCRDSFLQIPIYSECPILEFKIGQW